MFRCLKALLMRKVEELDLLSMKMTINMSFQRVEVQWDAGVAKPGAVLQPSSSHFLFSELSRGHAAASRRLAVSGLSPHRVPAASRTKRPP